MSTADTVNVRYMVDDVDEAIAFYTELLGFELISSAAPASRTSNAATCASCSQDRQALRAGPCLTV